MNDWDKLAPRSVQNRRIKKFLSHWFWHAVEDMYGSDTRWAKDAKRFLYSKDGKGLMTALGMRPFRVYELFDEINSYIKQPENNQGKYVRSILTNRIIIDCANAQMTVKEIALSLGFSVAHVLNVLAKHGVKHVEDIQSMYIYNKDLPKDLVEYLQSTSWKVIHEKKKAKMKQKTTSTQQHTQSKTDNC